MMTPPTPFHELKGLPILGSLPPLRRDALSFFTRVLEEHGDRVFMRVPGRSILLLCHPQDIEQVLVRDQQAYGRSAEMRRLRPVFGRGLLASEGELWQRQRSLIQPNFQHNALAATYGLMWDAIRTQIASWRDGDVVDIHAQMLEYSRNIICRVLFGREFQPAQTELGRAVTTIFGDLRSEILYLRLWRRLPTRRSRQWNGAVRILNAAIRGYIGERRRSGAHGDDLLATLMGARDSQGAPMSDQQVHDEVLTFFLAGHETAALSLTWALYLLARHPDHQQASREEAQRVLSAAGHRPESYAQLRLISGVVKETLRLYPPVWSMGREVTTDTHLDGRALARRTDVWICLHRLHRDPRWYSAPTSFDPTRWLQPSKQLFTYLPFGVGARVCIGRNFATAESVLGLAAVLREFRVEPADVSEIDPKAWITLRPDSAIRLRLSKVRADLMGDRDIDQV